MFIYNWYHDWSKYSSNVWNEFVYKYLFKVVLNLAMLPLTFLILEGNLLKILING
jgi:hypothetical protein